MKHIIAIGMLIGLAGNALVCAGEGELLPQYFEALRDRGLFLVAEEYASARLGDPRLPAADRIGLKIELGRTFSEHGMFSSATQRDELWRESTRALQMPSEIATTAAQSRQLEVWRAVLAAQQAGGLAFESSLQPELESLRITTEQRLQTALKGIQQQLTLLDAAPLGESELSLTQRQKLQQILWKSAGESWLWLAQLEVAPVHRTAYLVDADQALDKAGRIRSAGRNLAAISLLQARAARLQHDFRRAEKLLQRAEAADLRVQGQDEILAERIRLDLSQGKLDVALQTAMHRLREAAPPADELRAVVVEALLQAAQLAAEKKELATRDQALTEARNQAAKTFGRWRLQTEILMQRQQQNEEYGPELADKVRLAAAAWQAQQIDEAVDRYAAAAALALQTDHPAQAFELAFTRASILLQGQAWARAEVALADLERTFPTHPRLAEADLLRCYALERIPGQGDRYDTALQEHLRRFPDSATAGDALWMSGLVAEQRQQWPTAIERFQSIPAGSPRKAAANQRILALIEQQLAQPQIAAAERAQLQNSALAAVREIGAPLMLSTEALDQDQCRTLLQCARLCVIVRPPRIDEVQQMLQKVRRRVEQEQEAATARQQTPEAPWEALSRDALQLRIVALGSQEKFAEARALLQELKQNDPDRLLAVLASLTDLGQKIDPGNQQQLGELQRMTVEELRQNRRQMNAAQQQQLDQAAIQASLALQDWFEAIRLTEEQLSAHPQDVVLMRQLIELSMQRGTPADLTRARELWTQLERFAPKGSAAWVEARIQIAELQLQAGDIQGARKLLGVTRTLYPQLASPELKRRGDELWDKLSR